MHNQYQIRTWTAMLICFLACLLTTPFTVDAEYPSGQNHRGPVSADTLNCSLLERVQLNKEVNDFHLKLSKVVNRTIPLERPDSTYSWNIITQWLGNLGRQANQILVYPNLIELCSFIAIIDTKVKRILSSSTVVTNFLIFTPQNDKEEIVTSDNKRFEQIQTTNEPPNTIFFSSAPSEVLPVSKTLLHELLIICILLFITCSAGAYLFRKKIVKFSKNLFDKLQKRTPAGAEPKGTTDKYRLLFETVIDPVLVADMDSGLIVECNKTAEAFFGRTRKELIGLHQSQLEPDCDNKQGEINVTHGFKLLCEHPQITLEVPLRCAQGRIQLLSVQVALFRHNKQNLIMGVFHDITKQKQIVEALNKNEKMLRKAQSIVKLGHWELDTRHNKLVWSEQVYHIFGIDPCEHEMTYETFMACVHPEDRAAVNQAYTQSLLEKQDGYEINHRIIRKNDGQLRYVQEKCEHFRNQDGEIILSIGTVQDTTEQSNTELKLREALHNAELANKSKSIFLANMSHEIRTPLNGIIGMLQLLQFENQRRLQLEYITHAMNSGKRLTSLLSDILDLSKVDAGVLTVRSEPFNLTEVIQSITQLFTPAIKQKGLDFTLYIAPSVQTNLIGDPLRLQQILSNIIGNAIKFTESGSVELEIFPLPVSEENHCNLLFTVSDDGIGIPEDKLDIVFDAFMQVESSYTRNFQGAGLGLSISKNLISLMGGQISVASSPGLGSCFQFCIPFLVHRDPPCSPPPQNNTYDLSALNILLAEDDTVSQRAVAGLLRRMGQSVRVVENGQQALAALQQEHFDLILMDIQMPIMEGVETTRAIRAGKAGADKKDIPIVAITAYAMAGDKEVFLNAGMNAYLPKPVQYDNLQSVLTHFAEAPVSVVQTQ